MHQDRQCVDCKKFKPVTEFWKNSKRKDGLKVDCKDCAQAYNAAYHAKNKASIGLRHRKRQLKDKFGLTLEQYDDILKLQGNSCALCGNLCQTGKSLAVDHDHNTGKVRGLLCAECNTTKVSNHTLETARKLVEFLENPPAERIT